MSLVGVCVFTLGISGARLEVGLRLEKAGAAGGVERLDEPVGALADPSEFCRHLFCLNMIMRLELDLLHSFDRVDMFHLKRGRKLLKKCERRIDLHYILFVLAAGRD